MRPLKVARLFLLSLLLTLTAAASPILPSHPPILFFKGALLKSAFAHQVEIVEDVGATLHIEPDDNPRAGEEILAWFALTRRGGQTIPLADCDCQLAVYDRPEAQLAEDATPLLTPTLAPVDAEGYQEIPGAMFTFPDVGAYSLAISGTPKTAEDFTPFELTFEVTVASALPTVPEDETAALPAPQPSAEPVAETDGGRSPALLWGAIAIGSAALLGIGAIFLRSRKQKP